MTMIARVADGLPLAATMQEDEQASVLLLKFPHHLHIIIYSQEGTYWITKTRQNCFFENQDPSPLQDVQLKQDHIYSSKSFNKFCDDVLLKCFSYLIEYEVCYLVLCEKNYSKRLAYSYLEDIAQEFHSQYGKRVNTVTRPYTFIEFDTYIQKAKKSFTDSRSRRNLNTINNQLHDVQRIMVQNIDDVLQRGTVLSGKSIFLCFVNICMFRNLIFRTEYQNSEFINVD